MKTISRVSPVRSRSTLARLTLVLALAVGLLPLRREVQAQTLARPGWAGSGMKVAQWWQNSVIVEVFPQPGEEGTVLGRTRLQLGDLQTLGTDAILLRGMDAGAAGNGGEPRLTDGYGTIDDFDELMREASGRRIRLMVELPAGLAANALLADARFWLNRGVSGVYLQGDTGAVEGTAQALRGVLRSYVGDRVLAIGGAAGDGGTGAGGRPGFGAEMIFSALKGFGGGAQLTDTAEVRASIEAAGRGSAGGSVVEVDPKAPAVAGEEAKARATALLIVRGSVALRAQDVGAGPEEQARRQEADREAAENREIAAATSPAAASNARRAAAARKAAAATALELPGDATFVWYRRMIGLHRGNAALLGGEQTLLNEDSAGALVAVWRPRLGKPLVAAVNLHPSACKLLLTDDFVRLGMRGLFLRAVVRSDAGMGAMPMGAVSLPGYGVYLGQMGR